VKRWFRPVAYSLIAVLVAMAVFANPSPEAADDFVRAVPRDASEAPSEGPATGTTAGEAATEAMPPPALQPRDDAHFAAGLFAAPAPPPPPPVEVPAPVEAPIPELKVLGWLELDGAPQVFVELNGETDALTPGQLAGDVFRFDSLGAGTARFTYLPTGATREFAVSDPAASE
jgi:hypothetical protein